MHCTAAILDPHRALQLLRRRARRVAAGQDAYPVRAAGASSAAHREPDCRCRLCLLPTFDVLVPQTVDKLVGALLHLDTPRRVQDLVPIPLFSFRVPRLWSRSPTPQFLVVVSVEVFQFFTQDKVQQQSQSKSLTFQFRTVAASSKILVSHRFHKKLLGKRFKCFFSTFPRRRKSAQVGPHSWSELSADFTPSTLRAQQQSTSPAMERETWVNGDDVWVRVDTLQGPYWRLLLSDHWQWHPLWLGH